MNSFFGSAVRLFSRRWLVRRSFETSSELRFSFGWLGHTLSRSSGRTFLISFVRMVVRRLARSFVTRLFFLCNDYLSYVNSIPRSFLFFGWVAKLRGLISYQNFWLFIWAVLVSKSTFEISLSPWNMSQPLRHFENLNMWVGKHRMKNICSQTHKKWSSRVWKLMDLKTTEWSFYLVQLLWSNF